ncbi:MAG: LpxL/LpxP family Kdo(2)-lipid IV(A) lauroyl/palmitoleoyl acyltransferase [Gammaproteobacteria bacterium]|nr:LpxL/LpxP family Kdo(2)-lipid IV(A) lauroyl/palmitoleoyl acyltransferase [Gammaproteobacteria bacterium]
MKDKQKPDTGLRLIAPRYWPTWLSIGLMWLVVKLPFRLQLAIGRRLGRLFKLFSSYRHTIVRTNIGLCFPELDTLQQAQLINRCYDSLGMSLVETAFAFWANTREIDAYGKLEGLEHIESAQQQGKGVLLLSGHFCSLEFAGRTLMNHYPVCFTYQELRNKLSDWALTKAREKYGKTMIHRHDIRGFIRALRAGEVVWYAPDQDPGRKNSVFAPFFNIPANTLTATTKLARLTGAAVMPFSIQRLPDAQGYKLAIEPALENFPGENETEDATRLNAIIESQVRKNPEQYLWIHRRFKERPKGETKVYPPKPRRAKRQLRLQKQSARKSSD